MMKTAWQRQRGRDSVAKPCGGIDVALQLRADENSIRLVHVLMWVVLPELWFQIHEIFER